MIRCESGDLADALGGLALPDHTLVFVTRTDITAEWTAVLRELTEAFTLTQEAARREGPVVFVLNGDDLLGRRGTGQAMVACGLLSGARTLALESARSGVPVNILAMSEDTSPQLVSTWVESLCRVGGPHGELIRLGGGHLGKALP
jgi:hypothetical protein